MASFSERFKSVTTTPSTANVFDEHNTELLVDAGDSVASEEVFERIQNSLYLWIDDYEDSDFSHVDSLKNVSISAQQVNLTQEENSQVIPFELNRYYDGIDLSQMTFQIYYVNAAGQEGLSTPINVLRSKNKIRFYWLVDGGATSLEGTISFEIRAEGSVTYNSEGRTLSKSYKWKSKPNSEINILKSLSGNGAIEPSVGWDTYLQQVSSLVSQAGDAATSARQAANDAQNALQEVDSKIDNASTGIADQTFEKVSASMADTYYTKNETYSKEEIDAIDVTEQLGNYALKTDIPTDVGSFRNDVGYLTEHQSLDDYAKRTELEGLASESFVKEEIGKVDVSEQLSDYAKKSELEEKINSIDVTGQLVDYAKKSEVYSKTEVDTKTSTLSSSIDANTSNINAVSQTVQTLQETVNKVDTSPRLTYDVAYNDTEDEEVGENVFVLYEIQNEGQGNEERTAKKKFTVVGGSGGGASSSTLKIGYISTSPVVATADDKVLIKYSFTGTDSSGDDIPEGNYTWKLGNKVIATGIATNGENTFDATDFVSVGTQKLTLQIKDDAGSLVTKAWTVQIVDVRIESTFNDAQKYSIGKEVSFNYTPYGAIQKTIHFKLDNTEIFSTSTTSSGIPMSYNIQPREHGSHLVEVYITAEINNSTIESNHVFKDIIWFDDTSNIPVIGCTSKDLTVKQYDTASIVFSVYDSNTETPVVELGVDGESVSILTLESNTYTWQYKATDVGSHVLTITCGQTVKTINISVEELDIDVSPVTAGLEFDFNPIGYSNSDVNRVWSDGNVSMTVSDNFDWQNGGYQIDENGDQYFCVKSGTTATINYDLFADDPKRNGKEFKVIFKTTNVRKRDSSFITCMDSGIGLDMKIESANIYSSNDSLYSPYCEDDIIEFEFNINKDTDISMVLTYEDGVANRPMIYTSDSSFLQTTPQPIVIGSEDCDVYIYRMKAYSNALSDRDILSNFIADARNAEEMISRYNRNQIYDENGSLDPYILAEKCPDLRIILVDCPHFTTDKSDKVKNTTITMIYKNGDPVLDNWTCVNAAVSGQGTSSNEYGYSARNLDLIMNYSDSLITFGDGETTGKTVTFTRDSIPVDYLNFKANVASSENQNNAQMTMRYNQYNPYIRPARLVNPNKRDTMAFYNAVVFIREYDTDLSTHKEFNECEKFHYYALGNIGDSKKTDKARVLNADDPKEHCIEIMDYNVALAEFPTGYTDRDGNKAICPENEWKKGNPAYDYLYADYKYKDGNFKSFGSESYEFRYEKDGITTEERQANIDAWREAYKFVVTSDDNTFKSDFKKYFVQDSVLFYYLFVERYTLVDNLAKNCFPQYAKAYFTKAEAEQFKEDYGVEIQPEYIDDELGAFNGGYRYNWTQAYDFDTTLGISNTGKLEIDYGKELVDYNIDGDPSSALIFRAGASTFWCRIRDLFASELEALFVECESNNAWSAAGLINQWDKQQQDFPEELWRKDIERKYFRTYQGVSLDDSIAGAATPRFLAEMLNGRKKYQRRMFERNQELYMATKYFGNTATQDQIMMRFNNPSGVETDFTLYLTPYSDMYIGVKFGNFTPINFRAKAGKQYTVPYTLETADITLIFGASFIQEIGDLSKCYVGDNDFSKASRLKKLSIGSDKAGYSNGFMSTIGLGSNKLLEYLDIRNITGLNSVVDLSNCNNLLELHAEGSGATGVIFSNGGKVEKAYLPSISSLTVKNLNNLEVFQVESYNNLLSLIVENTPFLNTYDIVNSASKLNILRLIGMNWDKSYNISDSSILNRLLTLRGIGNDGYETPTSMLAGNFFAAVVRQKELESYNKVWKNLEVSYNTLIEQFAVTFVNEDGTVLDIQYVDKGGDAVDPVTRSDNPIPTPTKESTVSTDFTFAKWDMEFTGIFAPRTITATYTESVRQYTITYKSMGTTLSGYPKTGLYGENIPYEGETPVYTSEESGYTYYLFDRWDKSGIIDGDKVVNAVFDKCEYRQGYFTGKELSDLRPVEIYTMIKVGAEQTYVEDMDEFNFSMGHDYDYDDVISHEFIKEKTAFNGTNYVDTNISVMDIDRSFVLAIDYEFGSNNSSGSTLMQCFQTDGSNGFKLSYNSSPTITWGTNSKQCASGTNREMLVLRHTAGDTKVYVYTSNLANESIGSFELDRNRSMTMDSTLVFGCVKADDGMYESYAKGNIYWAKLWFADLGDSACKKIASYIHEDISLNMCGFKRKYLSNISSQRSSMSFLSSHVIYVKKPLGNVYSNSGGWASSPLNTWLNTRFYEGIPVQIKQLIKQVKVISSIGDQSTETSTSNCYIYIPSIIELSSSISSEPYYSEETASNKTISYMVSDADRIRKDSNGNAVAYCTRSPNADNNMYYHYVKTDGKTSGFGQPTTEYGIVIEISI